MIQINVLAVAICNMTHALKEAIPMSIAVDSLIRVIKAVMNTNSFNPAFDSE
jgi:hypothetical protein